MFFLDQNTGVVSGSVFDGRGAIARTTDAGMNWSTLFFDQAIEGVAFPEQRQQAGLPLARCGRILHTTDTGTTWTDQTSGSSANLNDVSFASDALRGIAVGDGGTILWTANGGGPGPTPTPTPTASPTAPNCHSDSYHLRLADTETYSDAQGLVPHRRPRPSILSRHYVETSVAKSNDEEPFEFQPLILTLVCYSGSWACYSAAVFCWLALVPYLKRLQHESVLRTQRPSNHLALTSKNDVASNPGPAHRLDEQGNRPTGMSILPLPPQNTRAIRPAGNGDWFSLGPPGGDVFDAAASTVDANIVLAGLAPGGSSRRYALPFQ